MAQRLARTLCDCKEEEEIGVEALKRNGFAREELLTPGKPESYRIELYDIAHRFDIVSWDPRGVGRSEPLDCGGRLAEARELFDAAASVPASAAIASASSSSTPKDLIGNTALIFSPGSSGRRFTNGLPREPREPVGSSNTRNL